MQKEHFGPKDSRGRQSFCLIEKNEDGTGHMEVFWNLGTGTYMCVESIACLARDIDPLLAKLVLLGQRDSITAEDISVAMDFG